jgi:diguanylate cyclase (GGDEF)-like protein
VLIAVHNTVGAVDPFRYGVFYLLLFVWIGMYHRPGTALVAGVPTLASYAWPLVAAGEAVHLSTAVYAVPMFVVVGEVIARRSAALGEAQARLHALAHSDPLTGLPNRRAFLDALAPDRIGRAGDAPAIAFLDLDRFKHVNDRLGHAVGDALLQAVAEAIATASRAGDLAARLAGDEFAVLLRGALTPAEAEAVGRRLDAAVAEAAERVAPGAGVRASVGIAWCGDDAERALDRADAAMYRSKREGSGIVLAEHRFVPVAAV